MTSTTTRGGVPDLVVVIRYALEFLVVVGQCHNIFLTNTPRSSQGINLFMTTTPGGNHRYYLVCMTLSHPRIDISFWTKNGAVSNAYVTTPGLASCLTEIM